MEPINHLSKHQLERLVWGSAAQNELEHAEQCTRCHHAIDELRENNEAFLKNFPSFESLENRARTRALVRAQAKDLVQARRQNFWSWLVPLTAACAACLFGVFILNRSSVEPVKVPPTLENPSGIRIKGASIVEVAVQRGKESFSFSGQPLRARDILGFRYSSDKKFLLAVSLELSGKVSALLPMDGEQSMAIRSGNKIKLDQGVQLDEYPEPERLFLLFTSKPLKVDEVREAIVNRYKALSGKQKDSLDLGPLPFEGEQLSWFLTKEK